MPFDININPVEILDKQFEGMLEQAIANAPQLVAALVFLLLTWGIKNIVIAIFNKVAKRSRMRLALQEALKTLISFGVWAMGFMIAAMIAMPELTPAKLLAGLGIGSLAIGLAFKETFENFMAGIMILMRKPMSINDHIECEGLEGQVTHISVRDTYIRRVDGVLIMVPNAYLYKNPLRILTDWDLRRVTFICGVAYGEDVDKARDVIYKAVKKVESVSKDKPIEIFAQEFNSSSIDFEVTWWTGSRPVDIRKSRDEVVAAVKRALDEAGIEIPFPYRTLTFKEPLRVGQVVGEEKAE